MTEQLLLHYTRLVEFLGHVLGPDYEIILHEILPEQSRVAAIANGGISGRDVGAPITNAEWKSHTGRLPWRIAWHACNLQPTPIHNLTSQKWLH